MGEGVEAVVALFDAGGGCRIAFGELPLRIGEDGLGDFKKALEVRVFVARENLLLLAVLIGRARGASATFARQTFFGDFVDTIHAVEAVIEIKFVAERVDGFDNRRVVGGGGIAREHGGKAFMRDERTVGDREAG